VKSIFLELVPHLPCQGVALHYVIKTGFGIIIVAFGSATKLFIELSFILVGIALGVLFTDFLF
jgi:hypothetical protein